MGTIHLVPMLIRGPLFRGPLVRGAAVAALAVALAACAPPPASTGIIGSTMVGGPAFPLSGAITMPQTSGMAVSSGALAATRPTATPQRAPTPPDLTERAMATAILTDLQWQSFAENREFCGYIVRDRTETLRIGPISRGVEASCPLPQVPASLDLVASFHTHSTYSPYFQSEFPTVQDMLTDVETGINGFISTPGGRLWYVDGAALVVTQLCGRGCLPQDPNYDPRDDGDVRQIYTLDELRRREAF